MKVDAFISVLAFFVVSVLAQTITLGTPTPGTVLHRGKNFVSQIIEPGSIEGCTQVGIALAIANCNNGVCPQPADQLGSVLYAGPWTPTAHPPGPQGGLYQNFTLQVPSFMSTGPAIFSLTHLCLIGAGPFPLLEFRTASVTIK